MSFEINFELDIDGIYKDLIVNPNNAVINQDYLRNHSVWTKIVLNDGFNEDSFTVNLFGFMSGLKGGIAYSLNGQRNLAVFTPYGYYHIDINYEGSTLILENIVSGVKFKMSKESALNSIKKFFEKVFYKIEQVAPYITDIEVYKVEKRSILKPW